MKASLQITMAISILGFALSPCIAQSLDVDSIKNLLSTDISDSAKLKIYGQAIWPLTRHQSEAALELTDSLNALSKRINSTKGLLSSYYYYGTIYKNQGKYQESLPYFKRFHDHYLAANDTVQITNVLYQIAVVNQQLSNYDLALEYYNQCIEFDKYLDRQSSLATTIVARSTVLKQLNLLDRAIEDQLEALKIFQSIDDQRSIASSYLNLGNNYAAQGKLDTALKKYDQAEEILEPMKNNYLLAFVAENRGNVFTLMKRHREAILQYNESLAIRKEMGHTNEVVVTLNKMANLYNATDNPHQGIKLGEEALALAEKHSILAESGKAHLAISNGLKKLGQYQEALKRLEASVEIEDSVLNQTITRQLAEMDAKYETTKKQSEIELLASQNELGNHKIKLQRTGLFLAIIALISFGVLLYNNRRKSRKIQKQNKVIEKSLEEKEYLLKEIHHRVKNNLQIVSSLLQLQSMSISDEKAQLALNEGHNRVRSMALIHQNLYQEDNLSGIQMKEYLEQLASELVETYQIGSNIKLESNIEQIFLDVDTAIPIGLMVNELITNSLKYGFPDQQSGTIKIYLSQEDDYLRLEVSDDGVGFEQNKVSKEGFGHSLLSSFAERLKADYQLQSAGGTRATFLIHDFKIAA